ncbi:MAG TPA: hypothetical protein V6D20_12645 [Candidatus Obscuribacterales bacterium]
MVIVRFIPGNSASGLPQPSVMAAIAPTPHFIHRCLLMMMTYSDHDGTYLDPLLP